MTARDQEPRIIPGRGIAGGRLHVFREQPSTNNWAMDHAHELVHGDILWAQSQTSGRGRFDRQWCCPPGKGLAVSVFLSPPSESPLCGPLAGLAAALGVRDALVSAGAAAGLKWPNDVMCGERKVAGILLEAASGTDGLVVGMGINVGLETGDLDPGWAVPATSLRIETGRSWTPAEFLEQLIPRLDHRFADLLCVGGLERLVSCWQEADILKGKPVRVQAVGGVTEGIAQGIAPDGSLRLLRQDGTAVLVWSGDVTLRAV